MEEITQTLKKELLLLKKEITSAKEMIAESQKEIEKRTVNGIEYLECDF